MGEGAMTIRGVTVTDLIDLEDDQYFEEQATRLNGVAVFTLRDEHLIDGSQEFAPKEKDVVQVTDDAAVVFEGRIAHITRELVGLSLVYRCRARTYEDLLDEEVIANGERTGARSDRDDVIWLVSHNPAISTDYTYIATIDATAPDMDYRGRVRQGMDALASAVGAVFWLDDQKRVHWRKPKPVGAVTAPWQVHTTPNGSTTFAPQKWLEPSDATGVINQMVVIGAGDEVWTFDHADSQTYFGATYEGIHEDAAITTSGQAERAAKAYFRRYAMPIRSGAYVTNEPGIRAGMVQAITIEPFDIDTTEWVASVKSRFIGVERLEYEVQYGEPELTLARRLAALGGAGGTGVGDGATTGTGSGGCGSCLGGGCCSPYTGPGAGSPGPGQPINDEFVSVGNGATTVFTTDFPYNPGSLRVWVDNVNVTSSVTETTPGTGTFTLGFAPTTGESIVASYNHTV